MFQSPTGTSSYLDSYPCSIALEASSCKRLREAPKRADFVLQKCPIFCQNPIQPSSQAMREATLRATITEPLAAGLLLFFPYHVEMTRNNQYIFCIHVMTSTN